MALMAQLQMLILACFSQTYNVVLEIVKGLTVNTALIFTAVQ